MPVTPNTPASLRASLITMRIIHAALLSSVVIYLLALSMVVRGQRSKAEEEAPELVAASGAPAPAPQSPPGDIFTYAIAGAAALTLAALLVVRMRVIPASVRGRTEELTGRDVPDALTQEARRAIGRYFVGSILCWALAESVAIDGLVLGILHLDLSFYLPFGAVSVLVLLMLAPRRAHLEAIVREQRAGAPG